MPLRTLPLSDLTIRGERALRQVGVYADLKRLLLRDDVRFRVPEAGSASANADRVLFLNLTFWGAGDNSDVLVDDTLDADVLAHVGWHHAARRALHTGRAPTAAALFLGEAIASAFDIYLIGMMLRGGKQTAYLESQLPILTEAALEAGLSQDEVAAMFTEAGEDPEAAFEALRALLFDAANALYACDGVDSALAALEGLSDRRFAGLLHHYALSAWVLYARAYAGPAQHDDPARAVDRELRASPASLQWLSTHWLR